MSLRFAEFIFPSNSTGDQTFSSNMPEGHARWFEPLMAERCGVEHLRGIRWPPKICKHPCLLQSSLW